MVKWRKGISASDRIRIYLAGLAAARIATKRKLALPRAWSAEWMGALEDLHACEKLLKCNEKLKRKILKEELSDCGRFLKDPGAWKVVASIAAVLIEKRRISIRHARSIFKAEF